jgi:hypothetical protein
MTTTRDPPVSERNRSSIAAHPPRGGSSTHATSASPSFGTL